MSNTSSRTGTQLLLDSTSGDANARDSLLPQIYDQLRALAHWMFRGSPSPQTLEPTELVHEVYLRLVRQEHVGPLERTHFFNLAARAMRQILSDHAAARHAAKRGGDWGRVSLAAADAALRSHTVDAIDLNDALELLGELDERKADVVALRFLAGLSIKETADALGVSVRTVELDWRFARAWLRRQLANEMTE